MIDTNLLTELQKHKGHTIEVIRIESTMHNEFISESVDPETIANYLERVINCNGNAVHKITKQVYFVDQLGTPFPQ